MSSHPFAIPARENYKPVGGYGVIGNTRTVALVGYDGSIDWCCLPRFDSPSVFAAILDHRIGGRWSLTPIGRGRAHQSYSSDTNVLRTEFNLDGSKAVLTDFMPCSVSNDAWSFPPEIHRTALCVKGKVRFRLDLQPQFDYGRAVPRLAVEGSGVSIRSSKDEMIVASSVKIRTSRPGNLSQVFELSKGESALFVLSYGEAEPRRVEEYHSETKHHDTEVFWRSWVRNLKYRGRWRSQVIRSALALRMLVYSPTGAIIAAPTTSLPEVLGGERNWDYRFSWIRDSALSLWAFHLLGDKSAAEKYHRWLADNNPALDLDLRLMYRVNGQTRISEKILDHLEGYRGSRPVRVGNAAARQLQMDAYGYMLDALYFSSRHGTSVSEEMYFRFVKPLAEFICKNWQRPGNGIWEIRDRREHFVYTKAWCYAGLNRAVKIARATGHATDIAGWREKMTNIKKEILAKGWSRRKGAFKMSYESDELDSANLMIPLMGFLGPRNKLVVETVNSIMRELGEGPLLYRYKTEDGLKGKEGAFLICSFWLVACLARMGRQEEARRIFEDLLSYSNHLGLYSEEIDPTTHALLGNFPQAFSHMGLIMAAFELDKALD